MKKNKVLSFYPFSSLYKTPQFIFLIGVIICGILAGSFTGLHITDSSRQYIQKLSEYVFLEASKKVSLQKIIWNIGCDFIYITVLFLFSAIWRNAYLTGLLVAAKGFILSFTICAWIGYAGNHNFIFSLFYAGLPAVFILPAILHLAAIGLIAANYGKGSRLNQITSYKKEILFSFFLIILGNFIKICSLYEFSVK